MPLLSIDNLSVALGGHSVLEGIDLSVDRGEIVTLVGPNGSGKSTLLRAIIGAVRPSRGRVTREAGLVIGYVPQRLAIDPTLPLTVFRFLNLPRRHSRQALAQALVQAGVPELGQQQVADLSGGQFQRILLARALLEKPDLLLLDEATRGLDHRGTADFYRQIAKVRSELGCAVMMVSHELHVVMRASDRVVCLNGHVCCQGTPERVLASPVYRQLFGPDTSDALAFYRHSHPQPSSSQCLAPEDAGAEAPPTTPAKAANDRLMEASR
ncbi:MULTISPECIES: metal ABC transporter ATP-binding protein [Halomonas]|uniref:metal ABC transporter ATP-binding protein n=1 Tax=Halomonas TaxID=2745 RepID=UPI001C97F831|nr:MULTISPECIES: metal ABC transporter ATP-binding protein [Halomonas]MBY5967228.1 metal ABC transporter ATP-binding protein [Halomonas denitrificans]MBY6029297.1 metal ABC transporter ATP-binding protein [Halomonas sp. DP8Y7-1]MED5294294.1 metal ABC transporter ATP-binding protein [Pseudomonadota bacterium]